MIPLMAVSDAYTLGYWAIGLILAISASPLVAKGVKRLRRRGEQMDAIYHAVVGEAPTLENPQPAPGMLERLSAVEVAVEALKGGGRPSLAPHAPRR